MTLAFGGGGCGGVRGGMGGKGFAQDVADLVGPATVVLDDFVDHFRHGDCSCCIALKVASFAYRCKPR
jgi:hypothetical protein